MRYKEFWPGDKVMTIVEYNGVPSGSVGKIASRWEGTAYLIRLHDDSFRWLSDRSFAPTDQSQKRVEEGEYGIVTSDKRQNFAKVGETFQVIKVADSVDYYGVFIDDEEDLKWFGGFQLAKYTSSTPS